MAEARRGCNFDSNDDLIGVSFDEYFKEWEDREKRKKDVIEASRLANLKSIDHFEHKEHGGVDIVSPIFKEAI
jgi:hypothetical protein